MIWVYVVTVRRLKERNGLTGRMSDFLIEIPVHSQLSQYIHTYVHKYNNILLNMWKIIYVKLTYTSSVDC